MVDQVRLGHKMADRKQDGGAKTRWRTETKWRIANKMADQIRLLGQKQNSGPR